MKGQFKEFESKEEQARFLKQFFKHKKRRMVANLIKTPEYRETHILSNMTSIIISLIELEDKYERCKIKQLDSAMDILKKNNKEFYQVSEAIHDLVKSIGALKQDIAKHKKYGKMPEDLLARKKVLDFKLKALQGVQARLHEKSMQGN